jgi:LAS superfamily LD-carboxypeptidase LdcB
MKTLCVLFFMVFLAVAVAEDAGLSTKTTENSQENSQEKKELDAKSARVKKSTKAYRKAKDACLQKSEQLKGKKLTDCIVEYQKEAK